MSKRIIARSTPRRSAVLFRRQERPNLINQQGEWLDWDGHSYVAVEEATIDAEISEWCEASFESGINPLTGMKKTKRFDPKPGDGWAIRDSLKKLVHKAADAFTAPCWLIGRNGRPKPTDIISLQNGLLDITTRKLIAPTPEFFNRTTLPIEYHADAPKPMLWDKFLGEVLSNRADLIALLQELFGYTLSDDTSQHVVPFLWGPPRSGKGTVLRILTDLSGEENVAAPSIMELGTTFGLEGCIAKSVLTITDMNTDNKSQCSEAAVWINKISGEDRVQILRKHIGPWRGRLPGRIWIASNNLPDFGSHTAAVATRLKLIPFEVSFLGREDRELTKKDGTGKLQLELPGILNWALEGLDRVRSQGKFSESVVADNAKLRLLYVSDPVRGFVEGRCVLDPKSDTDKDVLFDRYELYCYSVGTHPMTKNKFGEHLLKVYSAVKANKRSAGDGTRPPIYQGIRLNDDELPLVFVVDIDAANFGSVGLASLMLDDSGWPILQPNTADAADDFVA